MRDRNLQFFRSRRPPEPAEPETDGSALEAQIRAAFPSPAVSDALRARVAGTCRAAAAPDHAGSHPAARNRRLWMRTARWGTLGLAAAALAIVWVSGRSREAARRQQMAPDVVDALPGAQAYKQDYDESYPPAIVARRASPPASQPSARLGGPPGGAISGLDLTPAAKPKTVTSLQESRPDRYLIRNATLSVEVRDARQASRTLIAAVEAARGYVAESHESVDALGQRSVVITVRVPAGRFDGSLGQIEALGKVMDKQVTAEDVTEEFVDSQARLRNLQASEERLLAHLRQTGRLPDILLVENALTRVRGEIEQLEGRLRYLAHRIAYSTLAVTLSEAARPQPVVPPESYSSGKVAADAMRSLVAFGQAVWSLAIWITVWAVVWLPLALFAWLAYRRRKGSFEF
jgi:hypothetical protein